MKLRLEIFGAISTTGCSHFPVSGQAQVKIESRELSQLKEGQKFFKTRRNYLYSEKYKITPIVET